MKIDPPFPADSQKEHGRWRLGIQEGRNDLKAAMIVY